MPQLPLRDHLPTHAGVEKLHALTGLRFVAAAMIVLLHSHASFGFFKGFPDGLPLTTGVSFFFVLSGFILAHVYPDLNARGAVRRFLSARFARIWPAHLCTFLIMLGLGLNHPPDGSGFRSPLVIAVANAAMVHAIVPAAGYFFSFNAVSWSISTEFFFYAAFPLLVSGFSRSWWWKLGLALLAVVGLVIACGVFRIAPTANAAPFEVNRAGLLYISPLARLAEFVLGMTAAYAWKRSFAWRKFSRATATLVELLCVAVCAGCFAALSSRARLAQLFGDAFSSYLHHAGAAPAFALLILVFANQQGWLSRFFATRALILLGEISFSIYLLHTIFLRLLSEWQGQWFRAGHSEALLYTLFWVVLLAASLAIWRGVERPARGFLLRLARVPWQKTF